jgi:hypothetical protein
MKTTGAAAIVAALLLAGSVQAAPVWFDFEDDPDGLDSDRRFTSLDLQGVQFSATPALAVVYGSGSYFFPDFSLLSGRALELDEGANLTIDLSAFTSVSDISLDMWLPGNLASALVPAVQLFDAHGGELLWDEPSALDMSQERHYAYLGSDARRITIRFDESFGLPPLALDNLLLGDAILPAPIPEPSSYALTAAGLAWLAGITLRRRRPT